MDEEELTDTVDNRCKGQVDKREAMRPKCCKDEAINSMGDCDSFNWPKGPAMTSILEFGASNEDFYKGYLIAWDHATSNGWNLKTMSAVISKMTSGIVKVPKFNKFKKKVNFKKK